MLKKITESPYLNLLSGIILLVTSSYEVWESFGESAGEASVGAHHGIFIFALMQILKVIPEMLHGLKEVEEAKENS
jgi:hypothetical protein